MRFLECTRENAGRMPGGEFPIFWCFLIVRGIPSRCLAAVFYIDIPRRWQ